jgi:hypothetical protein
VPKTHVRFSLSPGSGSEDANEFARRLLGWFAAVWKGGRCTRDVSGDAERASFAYVHPAEPGVPRQYDLERIRSPDAIHSGAYRQRAAEHVWLLVQKDAGRYSALWLEEVLVSHGATDIAWFSSEDWERVHRLK